MGLFQRNGAHNHEHPPTPIQEAAQVPMPDYLAKAPGWARKALWGIWTECELHLCVYIREVQEELQQQAALLERIAATLDRIDTEVQRADGRCERLEMFVDSHNPDYIPTQAALTPARLDAWRQGLQDRVERLQTGRG